MAVDQIRLPADHRKGRKRRLGEEAEFLQIIVPVPVRTVSPEIAFIIDKVKGNPLIYVLQDSHIPALPKIIHIEMVDIGHLIAKLLLDAEIFGNHDAHVEILFVKALGQRAHYVRQSSGFDKRDGLGSYE